MGALAKTNNSIPFRLIIINNILVIYITTSLKDKLKYTILNLIIYHKNRVKNIEHYHTLFYDRIIFILIILRVIICYEYSVNCSITMIDMCP